MKATKRYTKEFKEEAVRLLLTSDKSAKELARDLGVSNVSLCCAFAFLRLSVQNLLHCCLPE